MQKHHAKSSLGLKKVFFSISAGAFHDFGLDCTMSLGCLAPGDLSHANYTVFTGYSLRTVRQVNTLCGFILRAED